MVGIQCRVRGRAGWWLFALTGLVATPSGCERRDCEQEKRHCEGSSIVSCVSPCSDVGCHRTWEYEHCDKACVTAEDGFPFCALSSVQDPACVDAKACGPDGPIECLDGYRTREQKCAAGTQCTSLNGYPFCAVNGAPDPRCADSTTQVASCTGKGFLRCASGYALEDVSCPVACTAEVGCVLSATKDPRCDSRASGAAAFDYCDGTATRVSCLDGYRIKAVECDCFEYEGGVYCR